jgi:hypothetical protein
VIVVINKYLTQKLSEGARYVEITRPTPLGNPFKLKGTYGRELNREESLNNYRQWLWSRIKNGDLRVISQLELIANCHRRNEMVYLLCVCKPKECHGDIVKLCVEWAVNNNIDLRNLKRSEEEKELISYPKFKGTNEEQSIRKRTRDIDV